MRSGRIHLPLVLVALLLAKNVFAQGCALCYTTTAGGGTQTIHALRDGILVLLVPPALMFVGLMFVLRRWRASAEISQSFPTRVSSAATDLQR